MPQLYRFGAIGSHVTDLQLRLESAGREPGRADGELGDKTIGALCRHALATTPAPAARPAAGADEEPPWLTRALVDLAAGVAEIPGPDAHPRIVEWFSYTTFKSTSDETPNCAAGMCAWLEESGVASPRSVRARAFEHWGVRLPLDQPLPKGAIAVFWRGKSPSQGTGHVGEYVGGNPASGRIALLGANQGDKVCVQSTKTDKLLCVVWPESVAVPSVPEWLPDDAVLGTEDWE